MRERIVKSITVRCKCSLNDDENWVNGVRRLAPGYGGFNCGTLKIWARDDGGNTSWEESSRKKSLYLQDYHKKIKEKTQSHLIWNNYLPNCVTIRKN